MRITLNLATRPFADLSPMLKRLRMGMLVLAVVAAGLGFGLHELHHKAIEARARAHSLDGAILQITRERQGYESLMRQPDNAQLLRQVDTLNKLFDEKAFSWTLAMESLETVLPGGVQVTAIEPVRAKDGHITLHLRVTGPRDKAVDLVKNLEHSRRFLLPRIVGENSASSANPGQRLEPVSASSKVNFDLLAEYNPPSPEEMKKERERSKAAAKTAPDKAAPTAAPMAHQAARRPYTGLQRPRIPKPNPAQTMHSPAGGAR